MKRRAFLGFMGGAAAGGRQLAAKAIEGSAVMTLHGINPIGNAYLDGPEQAPCAPSPDYRIANIKARLASMLTDRAKLFDNARREISGRSTITLSPNIHALRSVSLSSKCSMQIHIDCEKAINVRRHWLQVELDELLGGKS